MNYKRGLVGPSKKDILPRSQVVTPEVSMTVQVVDEHSSSQYLDGVSVAVGVRGSKGANCIRLTQDNGDIVIAIESPALINGKRYESLKFKVQLT